MVLINARKQKSSPTDKRKTKKNKKRKGNQEKCINLTSKRTPNKRNISNNEKKKKRTQRKKKIGKKINHGSE